ncbi:reverse transcriptase domain-containing protein [Tanacetum coccineum]
MKASVQKFNQLVSETLAHSGENDEDWITRVEILYKTHVGTEFKHKSAWVFLKGKHKWTNPESTNARRNRFRVTGDEPEHFGDDALPRPPGLQRIAKVRPQSKNASDRSERAKRKAVNPFSKDCGGHERADHAAYTDRFHELARLVPYFVTLESRKIERYVYGLALQICGMVATTKPKTMQISGALTDEAVRNGSIKKIEKKGNVGEPSKDKSGRDDNKRTRTENAIATTANPIGRENMGVWPKCTTCNSYHAPRGPCHTCFNCNRPGHLAKDCKGMPRNVNPVNARNPTVRACYECA